MRPTSLLLLLQAVLLGVADEEADAAEVAAARARAKARAAAEAASNKTDLLDNCVKRTTSGGPCEIFRSPAGNTSSSTSSDPPISPNEMGCDLALLCSVQTEIQGKLDEIIEDSIQFKQVLRFGGFASGAYLFLFLGYLLTVLLMGIIRYAKERQHKQEQERMKEADRAAKKLHRRNKGKAIEETESML
jgi:hypothetical protein